MFWYVVSLLVYTQQADASGPEMSTPRMVPYALVRPCMACAESDLHPHFVDVHASTRALQLGPSVREVLCLHACDKGKGTCLFDAERRAVSHAGRLIDGDEFYMDGRKQGCLPRTAWKVNEKALGGEGSRSILRSAKHHLFPLEAIDRKF
jgi:hypothetical protein